NLVRVAGDEFDWGGGQPNLKTVEVGEEFSIAVVDAAMRFVGDDEVEEPDIERLVALHHRWICAEVDALVTILRCSGRDVSTGFAGQVLLKRVVCLLAEFSAVAEEENPLSPFCPQQNVTQRDCHSGLASA